MYGCVSVDILCVCTWVCIQVGYRHVWRCVYRRYTSMCSEFVMTRKGTHTITIIYYQRNRNAAGITLYYIYTGL